MLIRRNRMSALASQHSRLDLQRVAIIPSFETGPIPRPKNCSYPLATEAVLSIIEDSPQQHNCERK